MTIDELYEQRWKHPERTPHPDIFEHLPTLARYAEKVRHITEIGTRTGNSTTGFLMGLAKNGGVMHSYDRDNKAFDAPEIPGVAWHFHQCNTHTHDFQPEPTELLFIDGDHSYAGVCMDLRVANLASHYIIMHDTSEAWTAQGGWGVFNGLKDFLARNGNWRIAEHFDNCNGLTVIERLA